uniref:3'-5' exonuclease n=1 Tax=Gemmatimonas sp. TaxID=1962908 RepID=UPI003983CF2E
SVGGHTFPDRFIQQEWADVVDAWQLRTWDAYRDVARLGRRNRLSEKHRASIWPIFEQAQQRLHDGALVTVPGLLADIAVELTSSGQRPFDFVVVDEAQDMSVPHLRFFSALTAERPDGLFFAGDLGQRIFQTPFSWKSLGVDVRGRSTTLRVNYRTSHQIRRQADRLLGTELEDVDGNVEERRGTVSLFNGVEPEIRLLPSERDEAATIADWIRARRADGVLPEEIGVFVRSSEQLTRAREAVAGANLGSTTPAPGVDPEAGKVVIMPMHLAKGLEFRAVVVAACDEDVLPHQARIESATEESDLREVYDTERQLLYVACTRARDHLLVTAVKPGSEFLVDMAALPA